MDNTSHFGQYELHHLPTGEPRLTAARHSKRANFPTYTATGSFIVVHCLQWIWLLWTTFTHSRDVWMDISNSGGADVGCFVGFLVRWLEIKEHKADMSCGARPQCGCGLLDLKSTVNCTQYGEPSA